MPPQSTEGYVPDEGHVLHVNFGPVVGHEQDGLRYGVVLSPAVLNKSGMCIIVPMTTRISGHASEVPIRTFENGKQGVALCTQITALDWSARAAVYKGRIEKSELFHIRYIVRAATGSLPAGYKPAN
jgi:mRNA interferase MazF